MFTPDDRAALDPAVAVVAGALDRLHHAADRLGVAAPPSWSDPRGFLTERAELLGLAPQGRVSAGGSCRLTAARDGWVAVNLPRSDDLDLVPAWLGLDVAEPGSGTDEVPWRAIERRLRALAVAEVVEQGQLLGLAVAAVPVGTAVAAGDDQLRARHVVAQGRTPLSTFVGHRRERGPDGAPLVVDLSSLWAGPLCGRFLAELGFRVVKVESDSRPDGARLGSPAVFEGLNGAKEHHSLPLASEEGRVALRTLLATADVVIEGSRPRALEQMGIDPEDLFARRPGAVWVAVTAYGRTGPWRNRVGFGDDAAAAGGLVRWDDHGEPAFVGDAVADPLSGVVAAAAAAESWLAGGGVLVDVALRETARAAVLGGAR
jgi:hypothetical protein